MTFWAEMKQRAVNTCYRREPKIEDPDRGIKMLAAAVILQGLLDDMAHIDRMDDDVYRFYADLLGIEADYITLLQIFVGRWHWLYYGRRTATAFIDCAVRRGW